MMGVIVQRFLLSVHKPHEIYTSKGVFYHGSKNYGNQNRRSYQDKQTG